VVALAGNAHRVGDVKLAHPEHVDGGDVLDVVEASTVAIWVMRRDSALAEAVMTVMSSATYSSRRSRKTSPAPPERRVFHPGDGVFGPARSGDHRHHDPMAPTSSARET
jgi:hypothetical protein